MAKKRSPHVAAHEAGHAAIAISLGIPVFRVCLTPGQEYSGYCTTLTHQQWRLEDALVDAGGPAADLINGRHSERWLKHVPRQWSADFKSMRQRGFKPRECRVLVHLAVSMLQGSARELYGRVLRALEQRDLGEEDIARLTVGEEIDVDG
jgi:hypothetical protein